MYTHQITVKLSDDIVHAHSILEWEELFLLAGVIERDELPLSYGRIAEIIAVQLYKYNYMLDVAGHEWSCKEDTTYTDAQGLSFNTKVLPVPKSKPKPDLYTHLAILDEPEATGPSLQIGISGR